LKDLKRDSKFNAHVMKELEPLGTESFDLTRFLREYVAGLCRVHTQIWKLTEAHVERWATTVLEALTRYMMKTSQTSQYAVAWKLAEDPGNDIIEEVPLFTSGIDRLRLLRRRQLPVGLPQWHVSNKLD